MSLFSYYFSIKRPSTISEYLCIALFIGLIQLVCLLTLVKHGFIYLTPGTTMTMAHPSSIFGTVIVMGLLMICAATSYCNLVRRLKDLAMPLNVQIRYFFYTALFNLLCTFFEQSDVQSMLIICQLVQTTLFLVVWYYQTMLKPNFCFFSMLGISIISKALLYLSTSLIRFEPQMDTIFYTGPIIPMTSSYGYIVNNALKSGFAMLIVYLGISTTVRSDFG